MLRHWVLLSLFLLLPSASHAQWYAESVYADTKCHALVHTRVYEIGRCTYAGVGGHGVLVQSSNALVKRACYDSQCKNCSLGADVAILDECVVRDKGSRMHSLLTRFPNITNTTVTTTFQNFDCSGPPSETVLTPGCHDASPFSTTCSARTQSHCGSLTLHTLTHPPHSAPPHARVSEPFEIFGNFGNVALVKRGHPLKNYGRSYDSYRVASDPDMSIYNYVTWFFTYSFANVSECGNPALASSAIGLPVDTCSYFGNYTLVPIAEYDKSHVARSVLLYMCLADCTGCYKQTNYTLKTCYQNNYYDLQYGLPNATKNGNVTAYFNSISANCDLTGLTRLAYTRAQYCALTPTCAQISGNGSTDARAVSFCGATYPYASPTWVFHEMRTNCLDPWSYVNASAWQVGQCRAVASGRSGKYVLRGPYDLVFVSCADVACKELCTNASVPILSCQSVGVFFAITTIYDGFPNYMSSDLFRVSYTSQGCGSAYISSLEISPNCTTGAAPAFCEPISNPSNSSNSSHFYSTFCSVPDFIGPAVTPPSLSPPVIGPTALPVSLTSSSSSSYSSSFSSTTSSLPTDPPVPTSSSASSSTSSGPAPQTYTQWVLRTTYLDAGSRALYTSAVGVGVGACVRAQVGRPAFYTYRLPDLNDGTIYKWICSDSNCRNCTYNTYIAGIKYYSMMENMVPGNVTIYELVSNSFPTWLNLKGQVTAEYQDPECKYISRYTVLPGCDDYTPSGCVGTGHGAQLFTCASFSFPSYAGTTAWPITLATTSASTTSRTTETTTGLTSYAATTGTTTALPSTTANLCPCPSPSSAASLAYGANFLVLFAFFIYL